MAIGMPGRHAAGEDHFLDHVGDAVDLFVVGKFDGTDIAGAVAAETFLREDRRDFAGIRNGFFIEGDEATASDGGSVGDFFAGEMLGERIAQVMLGCFGLLGAFDKLVVDRALVND